MLISLSPAPTRDTRTEGRRITTIEAALDHAVALGQAHAVPGDGDTRARWETLASLAADDLGVARAIEPHLDAIAILTQAGGQIPSGTWGVFAAEGGDDPLRATRTSTGWILNGTKPWCSLAAQLDRALVTAGADGGSALFAVDLTSVGVTVADGVWPARGLSEIPSGSVHFASVPAEAIGDPGWYLTRPGFAFGGIGVAACWFGGAVGIAREVHTAARRKPNPHLLAHLGAIDVLLEACRAALSEAAERVDEGAEDGRILAKRVRGLVARSCEEIIVRAGHALGPAPLAHNAAHAKRVADLQLYIRQHHAERDDASLGAALASSEIAPW